MTIDERLEALTINVEIVSGMMKHFIETEEKNREVSLKEIAELKAISGQLATLLVNHENRIQRVEEEFGQEDPDNEDESR